MRIFIGGGCKNGKSTLAQGLAVLQGERRIYIATMQPYDDEDRARVIRHRAERAGLGFETLECPRNIAALAAALPPEASLLLDSVTALLANEMFDAQGNFDEEAEGRVRAGILALLRANGDMVIVTDTIHSDAARYDETTEAYRRALALIDRALCSACDGVVEMVMGNPVLHKGDERVATLVQTAAAGF